MVEVTGRTDELPERGLLRSGEIAATDGWPQWFSAAHAEFRSTLLGEDGHPSGYPCHFGVNGERAEHNWFTALDESQPGFGSAELAQTLSDYAGVASTGPARQSLVVLAGPPSARPDLDADAARFWQVLSELSRHDREPWPAGRPRDPGEPTWQWCFAGRPWFVFGASPAYRARRSRSVGPCLTLVFQLVERVFEGLSGSSVAGKAAKSQIRRRLADYDEAAPHPHLGDSQQSSTYKWRQYFLPEDARILPEQACPWRPSTTAEGN